MSKNDILDSLLVKGKRIYNSTTKDYHLYNESFNEDKLVFDKRTLIFDSFRNETDLVKTTKKYPENDIQEIEFELDLLVIKVSDLKKILENE